MPPKRKPTNIERVHHTIMDRARERGPAARGIRARAGDYLLVLGARSQNALTEMLIGSTAARIPLAPPCDALVVPGAYSAVS